MIGIVLVTHGNLAREFLAALEHVVGPQQCVSTVCIGADDDMEKRRQDILRSVAEVDEGDGVVLLTDMFECRDEFGGEPAVRHQNHADHVIPPVPDSAAPRGRSR